MLRRRRTVRPHSGEVVVGKIGDDLRMDYTAQGHTALRLLAGLLSSGLSGETRSIARTDLPMAFSC